MQLTLTILTGSETAARDTRRLKSGTLNIGRAPDNDWVLPDPQRHLSKRHCSVSFRDGCWTLTDLSTNGTYLNDERDPIGHAGVHDLCNGDRIRLGSYEIAVSIEAEPADHEKREFDSLLQGGFDPSVPDPFGRPLDAGQPIVRAVPEGPFATPEGEAFEGPVQPDHTPGFEDAFHPPQPVMLLDEDWDLPLSSAPPPAFQAPVPAASAVPSDFSPPDFPPRVSPAEPAPQGDALMAAFLRGAGMPDAKPVNSVAAMENLGAAFRELASGLRETLVARAAIKSEFRIEQTMIRAQGNNPLKFSASDGDALLALLGAGRRSEMRPAQAVAEAFRDIRLHELATLAAMQSAVRGVLRELDPARFRDSGGAALLGAQRKARAFDAYEAAHAKMTQAMADSFESVFGKAFAQAYEQALRDIRPAER